MYYLLILTPVAIAGFAAYLIGSGLRHSVSRGWKRLSSGLLILLGIILVASWLYNQGLQWAIITSAVFVLSSVIMVGAGGWMVWRLSGWRKMAAAIMGIGFSVAFCTSTTLAHELSTELYTRCALQHLANALEQYHAGHHDYPDLLVSLPSNDLAVGRCPIIGGGVAWLYEPSGSSYHLGYWWYTPIKALGPRICLYEPTAAAISCGFNQWGPFTPIHETSPPSHG